MNGSNALRGHAADGESMLATNPVRNSLVTHLT